jgi:ribonuclease P protein component
MGCAPARLKRRSEFLKVAATRRKWVAPGLILQIRPHDGGADAASGGVGHPRVGYEAPVRVGYTVSRKVGNAVARNRARRRLKAVAETMLADHAAPGFDFVVIGRGETVRRSFAALNEDMETALRRLGAWREERISG